MSEKLTVGEIELIQLALECVYSELPEYDSVSVKLADMKMAIVRGDATVMQGVSDVM